MMTNRNQPGRCPLPTRVEVALFCTEFLDGGERRVGFEVRDPDELEIRETYDGWPSEQAFREEFPDVAAIVAFVRARTPCTHAISRLGRALSSWARRRCTPRPALPGVTHEARALPAEQGDRGGGPLSQPLSIVLPASQRWRNGRDSYRPAREPIRTQDYFVEPLPDDRRARAFVEQHHYSHSYPVARARCAGAGRRGGVLAADVARRRSQVHGGVAPGRRGARPPGVAG